jgi:ubiquinone biosynthesis protein UbiJ
MDPLHRPIAALLNRGIQESASARALSRELEGRSLDIHLEAPGVRLNMMVADGHVTVGPARADRADATLAGSVIGFNRMLFGDATNAIRSGAVKLSGDTEVAQAFQALLNFARPDPEEELSRIIGDVAAHQVGQAARGFAGWARGAAESFSRSMTEYLQEERRDLPTRFEMDEFLTDVDRLANDVERAAARMNRLQDEVKS